MNYIIKTVSYEFIYMYRAPWRSGTWTRTDTQPGQPGCRPPDAAWSWDRHPTPRYMPPDTGNPAGAHPTTTRRKPFLTKDFFEPEKHSTQNVGGKDSI